jgi:non-specific serine/threonine protein kinase
VDVTGTAAEETLGPYRLLRELGHGGMGLLYEAEHIQLERKVALKLLAPKLAADPSFRERFVRESQLLAAMEHPNIIPIYDAGEVDGLLYIAMRLVEGSDLGHLIAREGPLPPELALSLLEQVASALDAAHARDLVHRDVKPANILVDEDRGRVFLTDFGVARWGRTEGGQTAIDAIVGTVDYAAPEQLQGGQVGPAADVYALGGVLFEALTGHRAYERDTDVAVIFAHALEPPPAASELRPELPPAIDNVLGTAMAKDPGERYPTCQALVGDARAALGAAAAPRAAPIAVPLPPGSIARTVPFQARLPVPAAPLIGRGRELGELGGLLWDESIRLLTLTGPSGAGKTRLAIEAAGVASGRFPGGIAFVDLAPISAPDLFLPALSVTLGVAERIDGDGKARDDLLQALCTWLAAAPTLLLLDSFEHLVAAAPTVAELLAAVPSLRLLVTSHAPLHLRQEHEYQVPPLAFPDAVEASDLEAATASPAVALFLDRALAVAPDFSVDEDTVAVVSAICARLDGLPLAIELAASRVRLLSPQAILARLENALEFLTGGAQDLPARHQTLRAAIDWSYGLLEPAEQVLFERLGVFAGGFTLEAAESICGVADHPDEVLAGIESLHRKSLLQREDASASEPRLTLLHPIQEYALYRLLERGELGELRRRHANYYLRLAEEAEAELVGPEQATWVGHLELESGNLRAALAWALEGDQLEHGMRAAGALSRFWSIRGQVSEGRLWLDQALRRGSDVDPGVRAKALFAAGYAALGQGDFSEAVDRFADSLALARAANDEQGVASSLAQLGWLSSARGEFERSVALSEESLSLARRLGDARTASLALATLGEAAAAHGDYDRSAELLVECLELRRAAGDRRNVANALLNLGRIELVRGREEQAASLLDEGLELARELRDTWGIAVGLSSNAVAALLREDRGRARELLAESLTLCWERRDRRLAAECLAGLATVAAQAGNPARAARLSGAAGHVRETTGAVPSPLERLLEELRSAAPPEAPSAETLAAEEARGRAFSFEQAVADALGEAK